MRFSVCQVNHMTDPVGFSMCGQPVFHWNVEDVKGTKAVLGRIVIYKVSRDGKSRSLAADTGWAELDFLAAPVPLDLEPRTRYIWTVSVRTDAGEEGTSSEQFFETGKRDEPWTAEWIGADESIERHPIFTKTITPDPSKPIAAARLYISAAGLYEASWNGEKIGKEYLTPYCTDYNEWIEVITHDVTDLVRNTQQAKDCIPSGGENAAEDAAKPGSGTLSVLLGNGWYNGRFGFHPDPTPHFAGGKRFIAELHILYEDGSEDVIPTDESWMVTRSAITFSNIYDGEHRDDTLPEIPAEPALIKTAPQGKLTDRLSLPVIAKHILPVRELIHTPAGETVLDMGQNQTGIFRLSLAVPAGTKVRIQVGEVLQNGNFYRDNLRTARAEYLYVSNGMKTVLEPRFTFYGYRYVKIEGVPDLKAEDFESLVLYSDMEQVGTMVTGDEKVNRLILNAEWGKRSNFLDVPTDCPQRDERMGWTGDAEVFSPTALYQSDAYAFYVKYLHDMATEQETHGGLVPDVVPSFEVNSTACAWGDATTIIPWNMYLYSGDAAILRQHYPYMKSWVDYIEQLDENDWGWRKHFHYGDWLALDGSGAVEECMGGTDEGFLAEVYKMYSMQLVVKAAEVLLAGTAADRTNENGTEENAGTGLLPAEEYEADIAKYEALAAKTLAGIRNEYYSPSGRCCIDTQTAYLLSLKFGLSVDPKRMAERLVTLIKKNNGNLKTGFIGTPLLCEGLTAIGHVGMAYDLLFHEEYPGWLYEVGLGATTIWERWNSMLADGSVSSTGMNSFNHYSYGAITTWLYERAGGLMRDPKVPGWTKVVFAPNLCWKLRSADVCYRSAAGLYKTHWKAQDIKTVEIGLTVPFGCCAEVKLPCFDAAHVPAELAGNPILKGLDKGTGVSLVGPGSYTITYTLTEPLQKSMSTYDKVADLFADEKVHEALRESFPRVSTIETHLYSMTLREVAAMWCVPEEKMDEIDAILKTIEL